MKISVPVFLLFLVLISCSHNNYEMIEQYDEFTKEWTYYECNNCDLETVITNRSGNITDMGYCMNLLIRDGYFTIMIIYYGEDWLFIPKGNSLEFLVDGENIYFSTLLPSSRKILNHYKLREIIFYPATTSQITKIINGDNIKFKLNGKVYVLKDDIKNNWKIFLDKYGKYIDDNKFN